VDGLEDLAARATSGDAPAARVVREAGTALGNAIAHLLGVLDVTEIVVHGPVTALGEPWLEAIRGEATSRSLGPLVRETKVVDGGLGDDLTLLGAAAMLLTRELGLTVHR
jgi:predicted NBD/HSP70 family sugar kinase